MSPPEFLIELLSAAKPPTATQSIKIKRSENEILGSAGNFGWGGAYNTYFWADPKEQLMGLIWAQSAQSLYYYPLERQFMTLAYQALID